jgi:hypothetical protein
MTDIAANPSSAKPLGSASASPKETWDSDAGFYLIMAVISAVLVFVGFAPSFYLKSVIQAPTPPLTLLTITHGLVFTAWMLLFVTQVSLIARKQPAPHRQLGILGVMLFGVMISLGVSTALTAGKLGNAPPGAPPALAFMALPLIGFVGLVALVGTAMWLRRRSDWHKRLMIASVFFMTEPATGRLAIPMGFAEHGTSIAFICAELLLAAAVFYDYRTHKRIHPAYKMAIAVAAITHVTVMWAFHSPVWMSFARALTA